MGLLNDVTVVIPSIPPRRDLRARAVRSVLAQTVPCDLVVELDREGRGADHTRSAGLAKVTTKWVAFLDDDDELLPGHVQALLGHAEQTGADYVFSNFKVPESPGFRLGSFCYGDWDRFAPLQTTITILVRTRVAQMFGFHRPLPESMVGRDLMGEDHEFTRRVNDAGYRISHLQETTWLWHHHGSNTSGMPHRWRRDADVV